MAKEEIINKAIELEFGSGNAKSIRESNSSLVKVAEHLYDLMRLSLPSNLDEAAEDMLDDAAYAWVMDNFGNPKESLFDFDCRCFKAGAEWRDAQIPKLPDNINNAAKEYANIQDEGDKEKYVNGYLYNGFYAGAEWMAGQGETVGVFVEIAKNDEEEFNCVLAPVETFRKGDKVIVQIRKK